MRCPEVEPEHSTSREGWCAGARGGWPATGLNVGRVEGRAQAPTDGSCGEQRAPPAPASLGSSTRLIATGRSSVELAAIVMISSYQREGGGSLRAFGVRAGRRGARPASANCRSLATSGVCLGELAVRRRIEGRPRARKCAGLCFLRDRSGVRAHGRDDCSRAGRGSGTLTRAAAVPRAR